MKLISTLALIFFYSTSFSQWTRVEQLPSSDIFSLYHKDSILYAGGKNIIYISEDKGQTWDSTTVIPQSFEVDNIIVHKNELYAASYSTGIFKSTDGGNTWQKINAGIVPFVSDFSEWKGDLYAATLGNSVFKLDPVGRNSWLPFANGLSSFSANITSIAGNNNTLIAGTLANGLYDYLAANSTTWQERFLLGHISPTEGAYDIITAHDSLFLAGSTGRSYVSTDNGLHWNLFGDRLTSVFTSLVNAKQALLLARNSVNVTLNTSFYYIKKDLLQEQFVSFSFVPNHFSYKIGIHGDKLWDASSKGLFYMSLSDLPGISSADDTADPISLPVRFILFNTKCEGNKVIITWKTAQGQKSSQFDIEKSNDGIRWTVIGNLPAAGNSGSAETSYSFTDNDPVQNSYYRIAEYDLGGKAQYSDILRSSCNIPNEVFNLWPNPVRDKIFINVVTGNNSQATIKIFDSKGALVKSHSVAISQGSNQLSIDIGSLANGVYSLSVDWNNGQMKKAVQVLKQ